MLEEFSPAVERAMELAKAASVDGIIQNHHLLLQLLADDEGRAAEVIREHGGQLPQINSAMLALSSSDDFKISKVLSEVKLLFPERIEENLTTELLLIGTLATSRILQQLFNDNSVDVSRMLHISGPEPIIISEDLNVLPTAEESSLWRIIDVSTNRVREGLRVIEDYARFVQNHSRISSELKEIRHQFSQAVNHFPLSMVLQTRDTLGDVGTSISVPTEMVRASLYENSLINCKRVQEALRSLEEYSKMVDPHLSREFERIRYRVYTLEKWIFVAQDAQSRLENAYLYTLITGSLCLAAIDWTIKHAAAGGCQIFQLREKNLTDQQLLARAKQVRKWTHEAGALMIMNDRPDIALLCGADGVHLGQDDLSVADARKILGPRAIIGISTHNPEQLEHALAAGATYVGAGPIFQSTTKTFEEFAGLEYLKYACQRSSVPVFAIGGINAANVAQVREVGAQRVAVSSAIIAADDPHLAAATIYQQLV
ncbi:MAG: thiamine phosphate synthase [Zavarzinella sp.]